MRKRLNVQIGRRVSSKEVYCNSNVSQTGVWGRSPQPPEAMGSGSFALGRWAIFPNFLEKKAILIPLDHISHVFRGRVI